MNKDDIYKLLAAVVILMTLLFTIHSDLRISARNAWMAIDARIDIIEKDIVRIIEREKCK